MMIENILDDVIIRNRDDNSVVSEYVKRILNIMEYDVPYTSNDIMHKLNIKSKETFRYVVNASACGENHRLTVDNVLYKLMGT